MYERGTNRRQTTDDIVNAKWSANGISHVDSQHEAQYHVDGHNGTYRKRDSAMVFICRYEVPRSGIQIWQHWGRGGRHGVCAASLRSILAMSESCGCRGWAQRSARLREEMDVKCRLSGQYGSERRGSPLFLVG